MAGDGTIEEIKNRLSIVEVVGDYVQLKKAGVNYKGCCPFHQEKTPSFFVNPERQIYHCFGCGAGGDIFEFVQKMDGLDFVEALKLLANKAGVKLKPGLNDGQRSEKRRLMELNMLAAKMYHKILLDSPNAEHARKYVADRSIKPETAEDFLLGYSPNSWDATMKFLTSKGFTEAELFKAGLIIKSDRGTGYYDRFRGRLMFPIRDVHGEVIGFTARILATENEPDASGPKYINTPQTIIYDKSRALYGLNLAKQQIRTESLAVVVEGNMDVISSHQAGVKNVVASSGTALTVEQLEMIKRYTERVVLSFDNDEAGEVAAKRGIDSAVKAGFSVRILRLPAGAGKDPDDCVRQDVKLWKKAIADAVPYMKWYEEIITAKTDFNNAESKRQAMGALLNELAKVPDAVERSHWLTEFSRVFNTAESLLLEQLRRVQTALIRQNTISEPPQNSLNKPNKPTQKKTRYDLVIEYLLGLAFINPELSELLFEAIGEAQLPEEIAELYTKFKEYYNVWQKDGKKDNLYFRIWLNESGNRETAKKVGAFELLAEREFGELTTELRRDTLNKLIGEFKSLHISRQKQELVRAMSTAEQAGDMEKIRQIQNKLNDLMS